MPGRYAWGTSLARQWAKGVKEALTGGDSAGLFFLFAQIACVCRALPHVTRLVRVIRNIDVIASTERGPPGPQALHHADSCRKGFTSRERGCPHPLLQAVETVFFRPGSSPVAPAGGDTRDPGKHCWLENSAISVPMGSEARAPNKKGDPRGPPFPNSKPPKNQQL